MVRISDTLKQQNDLTSFPIAYSDGIWLDKNKGVGTADYSDLQTMYNNDELGNGGSSIQVDTMPIASEYPNEIVQYVGESGTYQNGYFYQSTSDEQNPPTYSWVQKNVQPNAESENIIDDESVSSSKVWSSQKVSDKIEEVKTEFVTLDTDLTELLAKIPEQASKENQLADKNFVNSSIATNTAFFKGVFDDVSKLPTEGVTNNDYAYVTSTDAAGNTIYSRYKFNSETSEWKFEYNLNNTGFTAEQFASINSGITAENYGGTSAKATHIPTSQPDSIDGAIWVS